MTFALIVPPLFIAVRTVYIMTSFPLTNVPNLPLIGCRIKKKQTFADFLNTGKRISGKKRCKPIRLVLIGTRFGKKPNEINSLPGLALLLLNKHRIE
jgi:hypothetical protein